MLLRLMTDTALTFRVFTHAGESRLDVVVTKALLRSQESLVPATESLIKCLEGSTPPWHLRLAIEDTEPFAITFAGVVHEVAIAHLQRGEVDAVLVLIADANGRPRLGETLAAVGERSGSPVWTGVMDWLTGTAPPLAALVYLSGAPNTGVDLLAMCVAEAILSHSRRE